MAKRLSGADFDGAIGAEKLSLVDFYSDSCVPCKMLNPVLGDIEDENEELVSVYKVNAAFDADLAEKYEVMSTPTLILFKSGKELDRKNGVQTKDALLDWIKQH